MRTAVVIWKSDVITACRSKCGSLSGEAPYIFRVYTTQTPRIHKTKYHGWQNRLQMENRCWRGAVVFKYRLLPNRFI